jgi:hypothetical protein
MDIFTAAATVITANNNNVQSVFRFMDGEEKTQAANHETSLDLFDDI